MKITARSATQVPGFGIVRRGHAIDWPDGKPFPPQVEGNFNDPDGKPLDARKEKDAKTPQPPEKEDPKADQQLLVKRTAAIGRAKLAAKLDALHVAYDEKMSATELAKILLRQNGEKID